MKNPKPTQFVALGLGVFGLVAIGVAVFEKAVPLEFWPLESPQDFVQRITPIIVVTVFMERALEVFISAWRGVGERKVKAGVRRAKTRKAAATIGPIATAEEIVKDALAPNEHEAAMRAEAYKAETQRVALIAGLVFGAITSAAGVRTLSLFYYPDQIQALNQGMQGVVFTTVDIFVTAAVIAGGADGLHQIVTTFLAFFTTTKGRLEAKNPLNALQANDE